MYQSQQAYQSRPGGAPPGGAPPGYGAPPGGAPGGAPPGYGAPAPGGFPGGAPPGGAPPGYGAPPGGAPGGAPPGYGAPAPGGFPGGAPPGGAPGGFPGGAPGGAPPGGAPGQYASQAPGAFPGGATGGPPAGYAYGSVAPAQWYQQYAASSPQEYQQIQQWFAAVDTDRSGQIDGRELHRALSMGGNNFTPEVIGRLIASFDMDNSGQIGLNEFVAMHKYLQSVRESFQAFDRDRSGNLDLGELYQAISRAGFALSQQSYYALLPKFDKLRAGRLSYDQYLDLCIWLGSMRKLMGFYDPRGTGFVSLNFDQLLAITPYYQ